MTLLFTPFPLWFQCALFVALYAGGAFYSAWDHRRQFIRSPDKGERYAALPLRYKRCCWFLVLPAWASCAFSPLFATVAGLVSMFWLKAACTRWYKRAGWL